LKFEWDPRKARENIRNHGVSFEEALTAFSDWDHIVIRDSEHSLSEERWSCWAGRVRATFWSYRIRNVANIFES